MGRACVDHHRDTESGGPSVMQLSCIDDYMLRERWLKVIRRSYQQS